MPRQNRVTPLGELIATDARGLVYGNRGCLHDGHGRIRRRYAVTRWISCRLEFRGWQRGPLMQPGKFTELFFLDEATAMAAGHRACALCRRADYNRLLAITGHTGADVLDAELQDQRLARDGTRRLHRVAYADLPDGAFVMHGAEPHLVHGGRVVRWTPGGYSGSSPLPGGTAQVITPPLLIDVLRAGWSGAVPLLHPSLAELP